MTTKKVPVEFVTEHYCDICGTMIGDGKDNGMGGIHFWGTYVKFLRAYQGPVQVEANDRVFETSLTIKIPYGFSNDKSWEVCLTCAERVEVFIESEKLKHDK